MDHNLFERGLTRRNATLGADYVENNLVAADAFIRPFQETTTAWCWGFGWGDPAIDPKARSMMNLALIGPLGKMHEWELHWHGALRLQGHLSGADPRLFDDHRKFGKPTHLP
jgi:4-carboxymuconolactone decarboxylase